MGSPSITQREAIKQFLDKFRVKYDDIGPKLTVQATDEAEPTNDLFIPNGCSNFIEFIFDDDDDVMNIELSGDMCNVACANRSTVTRNDSPE